MAFGQTLVWPAASAPSRENPWLWSRRSDLLWICGGAFFVFAAIAAPLAFVWKPLGFVVGTFFLHASILANYPHITATYQVILLERKTRPWAFRMMVITTPLVLGLLALIAIYPEYTFGPVLRLYLTWSAHHYAAQHFGIAVMYAARAGNPLQDREKLPLQAGFLGIGAFMMIMANTLGGDPAAAARVVGLSEDGGLIPIAAFPSWTYWPALLLVIASIGAFGLAERRFSTRTGKTFGLGVWLLFATNVAWFVTPNIRFGGETWMPAALTLTLIGAPPFFHSAQYLAVTGWRSRTNGPIRPIWLFTGLVATGFLLFNESPKIVAWAADLDVLRSILVVVAVCNLHHFYIDGLIWRRRRAPAATAAPAVSPS